MDDNAYNWDEDLYNMMMHHSTNSWWRSVEEGIAVGLTVASYVSLLCLSFLTFPLLFMAIVAYM